VRLAGPTLRQGCCHGDGPGGDTTDCVFPTTCYDPGNISGSNCNIDCAFSQNGVRVCTEGTDTHCQSYTCKTQSLMPTIIRNNLTIVDWDGAVGYGCGDFAVSTWIAVSSTLIDTFLSQIQYVSPKTLAQNQFTYTSYTTSSFSLPILPTFTTDFNFPTDLPTSLSGGNPGYENENTSSLAKGAIAGIVVAVVLWFVFHAAAAIVIILMFRRHRKLVAKWHEPGGALNPNGQAGMTLVNPDAPPPVYNPTSAPGH
jgi:hypothetical protein